MRLLVYSLLIFSLAPALPGESKNPADYPLRISILRRTEATHYHNGVAERRDGDGRANLFENGEPKGADFEFECLQSLKTSSGFETFPAKWNKPNQELVILMPEFGKVGKYSTCKFKVQVKAFAYYIQNGALSTEPSAVFKQWMTKHEYDPEHGKDVPVFANASVPLPNGSTKSSDGTLARARDLYNARHFSEALAVFQELAASGNAEAQRYVGDQYRNGLGVTQDFTQARQWYEKAAANGNSVAANNLGILYFSGRGAVQDYTHARSLFENAATAGNNAAMNNLGNLYQSGKGVAQDYAQARQWYEKAVAAGNAASLGQLGYLYERGFGVTQDYAQARQWYEKAAAAGNASGMTHLGSLYQNGQGVTQDFAQARQWYEKGAAAGDPTAKAHLEKLPN
jgi:uncharacterized protein